MDVLIVTSMPLYVFGPVGPLRLLLTTIYFVITVNGFDALFKEFLFANDLKQIKREIKLYFKGPRWINLKLLIY